MSLYVKKCVILFKDIFHKCQIRQSKGNQSCPERVNSAWFVFNLSLNLLKQPILLLYFYGLATVQTLTCVDTRTIEDSWLGNEARSSDLKPPLSVEYAGLVGTQFFRLSERLCQKCKLNGTNQSSWWHLVVVNGGCILPRGLSPYVQ